MSYNYTSGTNWYIILIIIAVILIFFLGFEFGMEYANPCVEYGDCEIICSGQGATYECFEECPCIERKFK